MNTSPHLSSSQELARATSSQVLVHGLLAAQLRIHPAFIRDAQTMDELLLDPLDLVLVALRLEEIERTSGEFPLARLEQTTTVGELVVLVDQWRDGALASYLPSAP